MPSLTRKCGVLGCGRCHAGRGLCSMHLQRKRAREKAGVFHAASCACASCLAERTYAVRSAAYREEMAGRRAG